MFRLHTMTKWKKILWNTNKNITWTKVFTAFGTPVLWRTLQAPSGWMGCVSAQPFSDPGSSLSSVHRPVQKPLLWSCWMNLHCSLRSTAAFIFPLTLTSLMVPDVKKHPRSDHQGLGHLHDWGPSTLITQIGQTATFRKSPGGSISGCCPMGPLMLETFPGGLEVEATGQENAARCPHPVK